MNLSMLDDRLLEYNFSEVLFSRQSDFQHVLIVDTPDFGRLLCLDYMTNLAESDTQAYTHSVMNLPHEDFGGKEVLILGGGDGARDSKGSAGSKPSATVDDRRTPAFASRSSSFTSASASTALKALSASDGRKASANPSASPPHNRAQTS